MKKIVDNWSRRDFLKVTSATSLALGSVGFPAIVRAASRLKKVIVLGVDGMDPHMVKTYMAAGHMPNCRRLMEMGCFSPIRSSDPPQSPVAWSNFISGMNPGGHGVFDFIARDSETIMPYFSSVHSAPPERTIRLGKFNIPVSKGKLELLRKGPTLWKLLGEGGIDCTVFRAPVNFPPTETDGRTLAGLGTPDIHGSYGIFTFFTSNPGERSRDVAGGQIEKVSIAGHRATCILRGPQNAFRMDVDHTDATIVAELDPARRLARLRTQGHEILLAEGEWSDWVTLEFPLVKHLAEASGICRFYLKSVAPHFELYVTPVNIDPANPWMPISTPDDYARKLVDEVGYFYTQGMPEDTSALSAGVFSDDEYREQATFVQEERMRFFRHEADRFREGFFFFYFSTLDLNSHVFWRCVDKKHPLYTKELEKAHGDFLPHLYGQIDQAVGRAMKHVDERTLLFVISDHGFVPFRRQFNLNSWLMDNGYARPRNRFDRGYAMLFQNTDWSGTKAYGLGINSLYLNVRGREYAGIVEPGEEVERLKTELIERLTAVRDPKTGEQAISAVYRPEEIYSGAHVAAAPDLVVGYNRNYRASWDTILGKYSKDIISDNLDPWSGDHCMDSRFLSGVFFCNRPNAAPNPALQDLAPTILSAFDMPVPDVMTGKRLMT